MSNTCLKSLLQSFKQLLGQISKDAMLFLACIAPVLCGMLFHFGIPIIERQMISYFKVSGILTPYYLLFDLILAVITPLMLCFVSAMVMLGEIDDNITNYLVVTPLGKNGYFLSRLGFPMVIAYTLTIVILSIFSLTRPSFVTIIIVSFLASLLGMIVSMLVVSVSTNKVEGMALTKLSGLFLIGLPVPFFVAGNVQYILFFLPAFWISKYAIVHNGLYFLFGLLTSICWMMLLYRRFYHKLI
jgi:fluoroquinolone transport system permease protein